MMYAVSTTAAMRRGASMLVLVAAALAGATRAAGPERPAELDPAIPVPESIIGHEVGADAVRYVPLMRYLDALAEASPLVTVTPYAKTHEGRDLVYVTITSRDNHARLEEILATNARFADPRGQDEGAVDELVETAPAIAWLAYCIHGDEVSPTDSAMEVIYRLAAGTDDDTASLRENVVIHVDPLQNADGRERYLAQLQALKGHVPNADSQAMQHGGLWSAGRGNHYLFDLNRDWLPQVQVETRGRARQIARWNPHFLIDAHEMGGLDTYLFDPPRDPINGSLAEVVLDWRKQFSADQARAFDGNGWSYYTREWYEEWYPGYTNAWAGLRGTIGLLYEAAGLNGQLLRKPSGETVTYAQAVEQNVVGTMTNLRTLRDNRAAILADFVAERRWAVTAATPEGGTFFIRRGEDPARLRRFLEVLDLQGIEYITTAAAVVVNGATNTLGQRVEALEMPAGSIAVSSRQPMRRALHAFLDFDPRLSETFLAKEREDLENGRGTRLYDTTAWNLPMAYGLDAWWGGDVPLEPAIATMQETAAPALAESQYGYVIDGASSDVTIALVRLFDAGCTMRSMSRPVTVLGTALRPGALLLRHHENINLRDRVQTAIEGLELTVLAIDSARTEAGPDLGGQRALLLQAPRVAIATQWPVSTTSFGATWHLLDDRLGLRASPINAQRLGSIDLRKYNVLILPSAFGLSAILEGNTLARVRTWVENGGTLIALGSSATALANERYGLSSVRRRADVLETLDVYAEAVDRERAALRVSVDAESVWNGPGESGEPADGPAGANASKDALARAEAWARRFAPTGAFLAADINPLHFLGHGVPARLPVHVSGGSALLSRAPVETAVRLGPAEGLRLSGLLWPEARERLANAAYATREGRGRGQVILFGSDPFTRGYHEGTGRILLNAILLGPGLGADQPVPW